MGSFLKTALLNKFSIFFTAVVVGMALSLLIFNQSAFGLKVSALLIVGVLCIEAAVYGLIRILKR